MQLELITRKSMKKYITLAISILLAGQLIASAQEPGTEKLGLDLTIVTSNVRYDEPEDGINRWDNRKDALVAEILSTDPVILHVKSCGLLHTFDIARERKTGIASYHGFEGLESMAKYVPDGQFVSDHCPVTAKVRL